MNYKIYVFAIMLGDKVVKEIPNVFAFNKQNAIDNGWLADAAQQYRDGKHTASAYVA